MVSTSRLTVTVTGSSETPEVEVDLRRTLAEHLAPVAERLERTYLGAALQAKGGKINEPAKTAGLSRRTLLRKLTLHGIDKAQFKPNRR